MIHPALQRGFAVVLAACLMASCNAGKGTEPMPIAARPSVSIWSSSIDQSRKLTPAAPIELTLAGAAQAGEVVIDPTDQRQDVVGFGAAMTDASAHLFQNVLTGAERESLFSELFGKNGLGISFVRVPIGASDFSSEHYSLDDMPAGQTDPALTHFSMARAEKAQIPALKAARAVNPDITLMASPWSAPAWMKTSGSLIKGNLKPEHYGAYARYFVRYLDAMEAAGLPVRYVSLQNEPDFEPADYPGMRAGPAERAAMIGGHLGPALAARGRKVGILEWDHNWDKPEQPLAVLADPAARAHIEGVAWHCYGGNPDVMEQVKQAYPDKELFFTECSGGDWAPDWGGTLEWMTDSLIIKTVRAGGKGAILWNLALDQNKGPHLGGCANCRAVVSIDTRTRAVTRNVEYYVLGHVSRFVRPGARVLASSGGPEGLKFAAFRNPDGQMVLLAHNATKGDLPVSVKAGTSRFGLSMPAGEVTTFVWR
ncbi:MAG: glycoside hydrolase family 30 beta sandwich domain-containing protein [Novosphingobium sp.]|uniref:glycoside hydrolase family 30 protein n=1 Tax=Novosphingobium sp. TaxID=1874826 RepID=UPI0032BC06DB